MTEMDKVVNEVCDAIRAEREQIIRVANSMRLTLGETPAVNVLTFTARVLREEEEKLTEAWRQHVHTEFQRGQAAIGGLCSSILKTTTQE